MSAKKKSALPGPQHRLRGAAPSHWIDERLPEDRPDFRAIRDELKHLGIEPAAFEPWLQQQLGRYRSDELIKAADIPRSEEVALLRAYAEQIEALVRRINQDVPWRTSPTIGLAALRHGMDWFDLTTRTVHDLTVMQILLLHAANNLGALPAKRGPKRKRGRGLFLDDVVKKLEELGQLPRTVARVQALRILRACGIVVPSPDQKAPEKAAARAAKRSRN